MKPVSLQEITTQDGLIHQGIFFRPEKPYKRALLWIHGLTGKFYGDVVMIDEMLKVCEKRGWGFASFNNRGHDLIASMHKKDESQPSGFSYVYGGGGYEVFEECVWDIQAGVDFLVSQGFTEVILIGHSTGALKAAYAEGTRPHDHVAGIVLSGGLIDRLDPQLNKKELEQNIAKMEELIIQGKGDELVSGLFYFPMTPKRYISLFKKGSAEEVFDYGDPEPQMTTFAAITKPLFVIVSENDEYLDRPVSNVLKVFDSTTQSKKYKSFVFPKADHNFTGLQKEAIQVICEWANAV